MNTITGYWATAASDMEEEEEEGRVPKDQRQKTMGLNDKHLKSVQHSTVSASHKEPRPRCLDIPQAARSSVS